MYLAEDSAAPHIPRLTKPQPCLMEKQVMLPAQTKVLQRCSPRTERAAFEVTNKHWLVLKRSPCVAVRVPLSAYLPTSPNLSWEFKFFCWKNGDKNKRLKPAPQSVIMGFILEEINKKEGRRS